MEDVKAQWPWGELGVKRVVWQRVHDHVDGERKLAHEL
jgi:hypothetical protein